MIVFVLVCTLILIAVLELLSRREDVRRLRVTFSADMDLVEYTRKSALLTCGVSTRGTLALYRASQIAAALDGRDYVIPEDVKKEAAAVLPHRLTVIQDSHLSAGKLVANMLEEVAVPLEKL